MSEPLVFNEAWIGLKLSDVSDIILGQSPVGSTVNGAGDGIVFYQGKTEFGKVHPTPRKYCTAPKKTASKGDLLLSVRAPVGPTNIANQNCAIGRGLAAVRALDGINQEYLVKYFKRIEPWLSLQGTGTTFKAISGEVIRNLNFPLPPLAEQKIIAEKLDTLLAQVENTKARLERIPLILKRFRQSVLAAAVSGKLTEEWRGENPKSKINVMNVDSKFQISEEFKGYDVPDSWEKLPIGNFCGFQQGMQIAKSTRYQSPSPNRLPILRIGNYATNFTVDVDYVEIDSSSLIAEAEDLILTRTGETRGRVLTGHMGVFHNNTFRINYNNSLVEREYLFLALNENYTQNYMLEVSGRSAQPDLTHKRFGPCPISIPPIEEQKRIVQQVQNLFTYADKIEKQTQSALSKVNNLSQSILAKAFKGELTAEWRAANPELISGENSAEALLQRIKAEREALSSKKKPVKKARKQKSA